MSENPPVHEPTWWDPLSEAQLAKLARITLLWSRIEQRLDLIAWLYLKVTPQVWQSIVGDMTFPSKAALLQRITGERDDNFSLAVREFTQSINRLAPDRNLATHGRWIVSQPGDKVIATSPRKKKKLAVGELDNLFESLKALEDQGYHVTFRVRKGTVATAERWSPDRLSESPA